MQGMYIYIPDTNRVPTVYSVAAVLYFQFVLHVMLFPMLNMFYFYINTFRTALCGSCPVWLFSVDPRCCAVPVCCSGITV